MAETLMTREEAFSSLLAYCFSGAIGPASGKGVGYALIESTPETYSWSACLEDFDGPPGPIDRFLIKIDRQSRNMSSPALIALSETELAEAILVATGQHVATATRFTDGALSISYKVTVHEHPEPDFAYVIQLRHHGSVASMDALMGHISRTVDAGVLPVPLVFPIPGERERQKATGMGRQITKFIPGAMASSTYPSSSHKDKLVFVRKMALAFQACWRIPLPDNHLIGELVANEVDAEVILTVGPDRHYSLGGPFISVRDYLCAYLKSSLTALEKQEGIGEYKDIYLPLIRDFIETRMNEIPAIVEDVPIVAIHADMGLHNVIVSAETPSEIRAVIDWELVASAPFASLYRLIETLFRRSAPNGFGQEYERADELREVFWGAIPEWKTWHESEAVQVFLKWFRFGLFLKPEPRPRDLSEEESKEFWRENIRVVEGMLGRMH